VDVVEATTIDRSDAAAFESAPIVSYVHGGELIPVFEPKIFNSLARERREDGRHKYRLHNHHG
jgi:hypothetical protein